jgi:transcriptional regulator of heat shock response
MDTSITPRQFEVLEKLVEEYIRTASPISSSFLKEKAKLEVCSATIRIDFAHLTEAGFLEKHYISGGRVPTDKAYRFFVDKILRERRYQKEEEKFLKRLSSILRQIDDTLDILQESAKILASFSSNLGVVFDEELGALWKEGWEEIIKIPEFRDFDYLKKFAELVKNLEKDIRNLEEELQKDKERIKVYIGKELPFRKKDFCMVAGKGFVKGDEATFLILGPKRMDFRKNICLLDSLIRQLESIS